MRILRQSILLLFLGISSAFAGELDNYYLQQFGELTADTSKATLKSTTSPTVQKCGMPLNKELRTDWNKLESATQKTLAKYLELPVLTGAIADKQSLTSSQGHFVINYTTSGTDRPVPVAPFTLASWIQKVADTFEEVYAKEVVTMGYSPPTNMPYPVYLQQMATLTRVLFGQTDSDILTGQSATSYITIDNDFADTAYHPFNGLSGLQITAAHEFHHAIQYHYNFFFMSWYAEATASWMEDEVYDSVNQLYGYSKGYLQAPGISLDKPGDGGYGRWIFNRLLAENHGQAVILSVWERLQGTQSQNGQDIPMLPVIDNAMKDLQSSLAVEFDSFSKRLYTRNWTNHTADLNLLYSVPLAMAASFTSYPVNQETAPSSRTTLLHYASKYFRFAPSPPVADLTITINSSTGVQTALFRRTAAGTTEIPVNSGSTSTSYSYTVNGFGILNPSSDEVVLMATNTTLVDNHVISFSSDGSSGQVTEPPTTQPPLLGGTSKPSQGCFIATAAYGSYLHPEVMTLRNFRDRYLVTNMPGRAFVALYYRISPPIADFVSEHESARLIVRILLTPIIIAVKHLAAVLAAAAILSLLACSRWWIRSATKTAIVTESR